MYNCEILNMYDANNSGLIETPELQHATADKIAGRITEDEYASVVRVWEDDLTIEGVCPESPSTPINSVAAIGAVVLGIIYVLTR